VDNGVAMLHATASLRPMNPPAVYSDEGVMCPVCDSTVPVLDEFYGDVFYTCPECGSELDVYMTPEGSDVTVADDYLYL